jgi:hypothetical protein
LAVNKGVNFSSLSLTVLANELAGISPKELGESNEYREHNRFSGKCDARKSG